MGVYVEDHLEAKKIVDYHREKGEKTVLARGVFDIFHPGHIDFLERAALLGDVLMVNVNNDIWVRNRKNDGRPIRAEKNRADLIARLDMVNYVFVRPQENPDSKLHPAIALAIYSRPDILVREDKDSEFQQLEKRFLREAGYSPEYVVLSRSSYDESSSSILERAKEVFAAEVSQEIREQMFEDMIKEMGIFFNKDQKERLRKKVI